MLREAAPDCRIVVLLRDPIERYRSAQAHDDQRESLRGRRAETDMFARGFYARQLQRLHGSFAPDRVLTLQYEKCVADPAAQLARTYRFLGLPPHSLPDDDCDCRGTARGWRRPACPTSDAGSCGMSTSLTSGRCEPSSRISI